MQLGHGPVLRPARIRFPQNDVRDARTRRQILQLPRDLIVKILCHVFRRRIHGFEGFEIVHKLVVEPAHDLADPLLEPCEVHQKPDRIQLRPFERHAHAIVVSVHVLALASVTAQGMSCRKSLFYADLKHCSPKWRYPPAADLPAAWPFRRDLPTGPPAAWNHHSHRGTGRHRRVRASFRIVAATPGKFYHRACAGGAYPEAQARRGPSSFGSNAQILASAPGPPAAPEIPQTGCARLPVKRALAPPRSGRSAPQMEAGRRSRRIAARRAHPRLARSLLSQTAPPPRCF